MPANRVSLKQIPINTIQTIVHHILDAGLASPSTLQGCTLAQILQLENQLQLKLPEAYKQFLQKAGFSAGLFMQGSAFLLPDLPSLRAEAERLLKANGSPFQLKPTHFIFLMHEGYQFLMMDTHESDDPAVWLYADDVAPQQIFNHFTAWFSAVVADEIVALRALRALRKE